MNLTKKYQKSCKLKRIVNKQKSTSCKLRIKYTRMR